MPGPCSRLREGGSASRVEVAGEGVERACGLDIHALHCTVFLVGRRVDNAPRLDGRSPTARFAVLTTRSLRPRFESVPMHVLAEAYPAAKIPLCVFEGLS